MDLKIRIMSLLRLTFLLCEQYLDLIFGLNVDLCEWLTEPVHRRCDRDE